MLDSWLLTIDTFSLFQWKQLSFETMQFPVVHERASSLVSNLVVQFEGPVSFNHPKECNVSCSHAALSAGSRGSLGTTRRGLEIFSTPHLQMAAQPTSMSPFAAPS